MLEPSLVVSVAGQRESGIASKGHGERHVEQACLGCADKPVLLIHDGYLHGAQGSGTYALTVGLQSSVSK